MKKLICLFFLFAGAFCHGAEPSGGIKIGVVDVDAVFSAYDRAEGISLKVREIAREGEAERQRMREEINILEREIRRSAEPGAGEEGRLMEALQVKIREYRDFDRLQKEKEAAPVHGALKHIYGRVSEYAAENGFGLVLEKRLGLFGRTVLFSVDRIDITEDIIRNL